MADAWFNAQALLPVPHRGPDVVTLTRAARVALAGPRSVPTHGQSCPAEASTTIRATCSTSRSVYPPATI